MASRHGEIIDALETAVASLLTGETIYKRVLPTDRNISLGSTNHVILSPAPGEESFVDGTSNSQAWEYPVTVAIVKAANQSLTIPDGLLEDRQKIRQRFHRRSLTVSGGDTPRCEVVPGPIAIPEQWEQNNVIVSILTVRVRSYEADT